MNILFLIYHGFSNTSGISKKIKYQIKGLQSLGHTVYTCTYSIREDGHRVRCIDDKVIEDYGTNKLIAGLRQRTNFNSIYDYCIKNKIDFVYSRSFHNANPWTIRLFKRIKKAGIPAVMEIPTYPYDQEYVGFPFITRLGAWIDRLYREKLAQQMNAIITFSNDNIIFGQQTIKISNGIDFDSIPLRQSSNKNKDYLRFVAVAEVHYWHGLDRFVAGIGEYYKNGGNVNIQFDIIGGIGEGELNGSVHAPGISTLIHQYNIQDHVNLLGPRYGDELDKIFNGSDFAVGSLGRHRSGITNIKTLKNREYAVRGIPFIYSENDSDFDNMPYIIKAQANEEPIDIQNIIDYLKTFNTSSEEIRNSILHLSWKKQMEIVVNCLF